MTPPPPKPAIMRNAISCAKFCAKPHNRFPTVKTAMAIISNAFRPKISEKREYNTCEEVLDQPRKSRSNFATRNAVPTHEIDVLVPKSFAMPGSVVDTDTCSKEVKNIARISDIVINANFFGGIRDDWSCRDTTFRSGTTGSSAFSWTAETSAFVGEDMLVIAGPLLGEDMVMLSTKNLWSYSRVA